MKMVENKGFKTVEFSCGGGGMTCRLRQAGIDVNAGVDVNPILSLLKD